MTMAMVAPPRYHERVELYDRCRHTLDDAAGGSLFGRLNMFTEHNLESAAIMTRT